MDVDTEYTIENEWKSSILPPNFTSLLLSGENLRIQTSNLREDGFNLKLCFSTFL